MNSIHFLEKVLGLNLVEEHWLTALIAIVLAVLIVGFINIMFRTISSKKEFFSGTTNLVIFVMVAFGLYYLGSSQKNKELEIVEFKTKEKFHGKNDAIRFHIKTNKKAFYYIYTFNKEGNRTLVFSDKIMVSNQRYETPSFRVKPEETDFNKEEKVILIVSVNPLTNAKKEMTQQSFSKMIELDDVIENSFIVQDKEENIHLPLVIKFKKDAVSLKIELDSTRYTKQEDVYIDTISSANGYVIIFEGTAQKLHRVKGDKVKSDERFKSQVNATSPVGEHIIVAIYTSEDKKLTTHDFKVVIEERKGRNEYALKFKNEQYPYIIKSYMVRK